MWLQSVHISKYLNIDNLLFIVFILSKKVHAFGLFIYYCSIARWNKISPQFEQTRQENVQQDTGFGIRLWSVFNTSFKE